MNLFDKGFQRELDAHCSYDNAGAYSNIYRYSHRLQIQLASEILSEELHPQKLLLDAGCWCGPYSIPLSNRVKVIGIDLSPTAIRKAKEWRDRTGKRLKVDFIVGDIRYLPFRNETFDIILCLEVLEHLQNIGRGLKELRRVMKTDRTGAISMPNSLSLYYIIQRFFPIVTSASENPHLKFQFSKINKIILGAQVKILARKSSLIIPVIPPLRFYESFVKVMSLIESKLNKTPLRNLGAHYLLKIQKPSQGDSTSAR